MTRAALPKIGQPQTQIDPAVPIDRRSLASVKPTDVLVVGLRVLRPGLRLTPLLVQGRAALYSLGFMLRRAAAVRLDVHERELKVGLRVAPDAQGQVAGYIFISDSLENGAGYSSHLGTPAEMEALVRFVAGVGDATFHGPIVAAAHADTCLTSCPDCLRDFSNLAYHNILDWRLGIDLARLALDPHAPIDFAVGYWQPGRAGVRRILRGPAGMATGHLCGRARRKAREPNRAHRAPTLGPSGTQTPITRRLS